MGASEREFIDWKIVNLDNEESYDMRIIFVYSFFHDFQLLKLNFGNI